MYNMPLDEFWNGPIDRLEAYRKAYYMKLHNVAHINGMYIGQAINASFSKDVKYPETNLYEKSINDKTKQDSNPVKIKTKLKDSGNLKARYIQKLKDRQQKRGD